MAATEELAIIVRMKDFATKAFARLGSTIAGFAKGAVSSIFSLKGAIAAFGAGWGALRLVERASRIEAIEYAFGKLTEKIGGSVAVLDALRRGTRRTVSDFQLMEVANRAIILGVGESAEQMELFTTLARRLGRAVGRDTVDAFNDLALGIGRQSRLILDNLGLIVKVGDANKVMAEKLGKTVDELTDAEKRQAFLTAAMEAARVKVKELGDDLWTLGDVWGRLRAVISNVIDDLLRSLTPALTDLITSIEEFATDARPKILNTFAAIVEGAGTFAVEVAGAIDDVSRAFVTLGVRAAIAQKTLGFWAAIVKGALGRGIDAEIRKWNIELDHLLRELEALESSSAATGLGKSIQAGADAAAKKLRELAVAAGEATEKERDLAAATFEFIGPLEEIIGPIDTLTPKLEEMNRIYAEGTEILKNYWKAQEDVNKARQAWYAGVIKDDAAAAKDEQKEKERVSALEGAKAAFRELRKEAEAWGTATKKAIIDIADAIGSNLTNAVMDMAADFQHAARIAEEFGKQLLRDIGRIITQMLIMKAVQAGLGGLGGVLGLGGGGVVPGSLRPAVVSGRLAGGRKVTHRGYYELAERGRPEVVLPMERGAVRAEIRGGVPAPAPPVEVNLNFSYSPSFVTSADETRLLQRNAKFIASSVADEVQRSLALQDAWRRR